MASAQQPAASPNPQDIDILVCNDDGITAPGIRALMAVAKEFGRVTVVAPDSPQSGMGHAISVGKPLRLNPVDLGADFDGIEAWACTGTPVDCIKLARAVVLKHKPRLIVSGINHGSNSAISILYSGTMSAAMEGTIEGVHSIGFSLCDFRPDADFRAAQAVARTIIAQALANPFPANIVLNVNIPAIPLEDIQGIRVTRQAMGRFVEEFERRVDPYGRDYFWLSGKFQLDDVGEDTDEWALKHGYVSLTPAAYDMTAHHVVGQLSGYNVRFGG